MNKIKLIAVVFILALFQSCTVMYEIQDGYFYSKIGDGFDLYVPEWIDEIKSVEDIQYVMSKHILYKSESSETWQSPKTTCSKGTGDCEDYAILMIDILCLKFGIRANLVAVEHDSCKSVVEGGDIDHAIVEYDGVYYEATATWYKTYTDVTVGYRYTFDELFK